MTVDVELDGYFRADMSEARRSLVLARWATELQDWTVPMIREACARWVRENPDRRPNYGHILQLLKAAWGEQNAPAVRAALAAPRPDVDRPSLERRIAITEEMSKLYPGLIKRIEPVQERASAAKVRADIDALNIENED